MILIIKKGVDSSSQLVTGGHNWSKLVTDCQQIIAHQLVITGHIGENLNTRGVFWEGGHNWSQLVITGHSSSAGHIGHILAFREAFWGDILVVTDGQTDARRLLYRSRSRAPLWEFQT